MAGCKRGGIPGLEVHNTSFVHNYDRNKYYTRFDCHLFQKDRTDMFYLLSGKKRNGRD